MGKARPVAAVVDDDPLFRRGLKRSFGKIHWDLVEAANAAEMRTVLRALAEEPPLLIVLDYTFPEDNGLDLIAEIKGLAPGVPIVFVSAHLEQDVCIEAFRRGVADVLAKEETEKIVDQARRIIDSLASPLTLDDVELQHRRRLLAFCDGSILRAAQLAGRGRRGFSLRVAKLIGGIRNLLAARRRAVDEQRLKKKAAATPRSPFGDLGVIAASTIANGGKGTRNAQLVVANGHDEGDILAPEGLDGEARPDGHWFKIESR